LLPSKKNSMIEAVGDAEYAVSFDSLYIGNNYHVERTAATKISVISQPINGNFWVSSTEWE